ncbi:MAG: CDP-diacylglycerol--serine O-phosphatidyltransferase [Candidatus Sumerlaeia bacterium]|nr:CDP-diacylglycerol--serine O-phosphatidyltransferase [Candidatus Sumerlaeia bacterium]
MRKVYLLPNLFTTACLFCGMLAVTRVMEDQPIEACWLILIAAILDSLDGKIARLTHTESAFGVNYDSLADLIAFGVAPAVLMFSVLSDEGGIKVASGVTTLYTICGALRLARFNVQRTREEKKTFTGLPIPGAAGMVVASFLMYHRLDPLSDWPAKMLPFLIVILACLMVSKIPYVSLKNVDIEGRKPFDVLVSIIVALSVIVVLWQFLDYVFFLVFTVYVGYGVGHALIRALRRRRVPTSAETVSDVHGEPRHPLSAGR